MHIFRSHHFSTQFMILFLAGITLSACMVGPDYEKPVFFTQKAVETTLDLKPNVQAGYIFHPSDLNDNVLTTLIKKAHENSPTIRLAMIRLRQARQSAAIAAAGLGPTFDAAAEYNYENESKNMGYLVKQDYYQVGIDMAWEIDIFGGQRRRLESAQANERRAVESLKNISVSLTAEVASTYIKLRTSEEQLRQAKENLILQEELYRLVKDQYTTGLADSIVLNQSKYLVESTKATLPQYEYEKSAAQNALASLLGMLPGELNYFLNKESKNLIMRPFQYNLTLLYQLPATVIQNRPDVRAAEEALIAQNATVGAAIADMYPSVSLSALWGFESLSSGNLLNHKSFGYNYTPKIGLPLFHFGALKNNVQLQKLIKEETLIQYEQQLLTAAQEIKNAMVSLEKERIANQALQKSYREIAQAAKFIREKYKNGLIDYSQVLDSEQRRLTSQINLIKSNGALYQGIVTFYKSVGGEENWSVSRPVKSGSITSPVHYEKKKAF